MNQETLLWVRMITGIVATVLSTLALLIAIRADRNAKKAYQSLDTLVKDTSKALEAIQELSKMDHA
jgi:hypothetical protein